MRGIGPLLIWSVRRKSEGKQADHFAGRLLTSWLPQKHQITSKPYDDSHALSLIEADFSDGGLRRDSFICTGKLFAAN